MAKEYIEREALLNELGEELQINTPMYNKEQNEFVNRGIKIAIRDIRKQPTADVQEVRHNKWEYEDSDIGWTDYRCDSCGNIITTVAEPDDLYKYCPNCGAKMDG